MPSLIGTKSNQVPTVGDLGTLAFQDSNAVNITGGTAVIDNLIADSINLKVDSDLTNISPSLLLDFANTKALDPRITFTRASTASFYDGRTTAKAEENLFLRSQEFDNAAWTASNATVTANSTTAPDGTSTAETFMETATTGSHDISNTPVSSRFAVQSGLDYTISVFAKDNGRQYFQLTYTSSQFGLTQYATFDLVGGTVSGSAGGTASIVSAGNGWYRCIFTATATASNTATTAFYLLSDVATGRGPTYAGDITKGIFLWGAQLEQRSAVSAYTPTTTAPITNYIPALRTAQAGQARFDHAPLTGESLGLLIEEQRTNLLTYSADFANAAWTKERGTVNSVANIAPDGTLTGNSLVESAGQTFGPNVTRNATVAASTAYTFSVYAKPNGTSSVRLIERLIDTTINITVFDLSNGTVGTKDAGHTAVITNVGNGWYRCSISFTAASAITNSIFISSGPDGNSVGENKGLFIWGAQLEAGSSATSYIPTVASQVTRSADAASMTGLNFSSWFNNAEGTLYSEAISVSGGQQAILVLDNANSIQIFQTSTTQAGGYVRLNAAFNASMVASASQNTNAKLVIGYKTNDCAFVANGGTPVTDTSVSLPLPTVLRIGVGADGASSFINGTMKKLAYYPVRLPNAELQEMTS